MSDAKLIDNQMMTLDEVYEKFKKLISNISWKYLKTATKLGLEFDDIFNFGAEGLIKAYNGFDDSKGFKFMTYLHPKVSGEIKRRIRDYGGPVKFSRKEKDLSKRIYREELDGCSIQEISEKTGENKEFVRSALAILKGPSVSTEQKAFQGDGQDLTIGDQLGAMDDFSTVEVNDFLDYLPQKLKLVTEMLLESKTQKEIGEMLQCSQVHVSRLLKKIRNKYEEFLEGEKSMKKLTKESYLDLKNQGFTDTQIAIEVDTSPTYLSTLKKKWGIQRQSQPTTDKKPHECKCAKNDKTAEYEAIIKGLKNDIETANAISEKRLQEINELKDKLNESKFLHAACEDVESESDSLRKERNEYQQLYLEAHDQCLKKDYQLQNQKVVLENLRKTLGLLTAENQHLWGLVGIQAAEKNA